MVEQTYKQRYTAMYDYICQETTLMKAFMSVKKNKGVGGIDGETIVSFEKSLGKNIRELSRLLKEKRYAPAPVKRVYIPKVNGKMRPLGIPVIRDRVVQQAVRMAIEPAIDKTMSESSYGFRPGRSAGQAIVAIKQHLSDGYTHVVDADIHDFFGTINRQILMNKVRVTVPDKEVCYLIHDFLLAGVMEEGKVRMQSTGTPIKRGQSPFLQTLCGIIL